MLDDPTVQGDGTPQGEPLDGDKPPETPTTPQVDYSKVDLDELFATRKDDLLKHKDIEEGINARAQSISAKQLQRDRKKMADDAQQSQNARQYAAQCEAMTPEQWRSYSMTNPNASADYTKAKAIATKSGATEEIWASNLIENFGNDLKNTDEYGDLDYEKLTEEHAANPVDWLNAIVKHGMDKEKKKMDKEIKAHIEAAINERLSAKRKGAPGPEGDLGDGEPSEDAWKKDPADKKIADALREMRDKK